jgi:hypothetical protein
VHFCEVIAMHKNLEAELFRDELVTTTTVDRHYA